MRARDPQLQLDLPAPFGWGGARQGSGRRPSGARAEQRHGRRSPFAARFPVHVTLRVRPHVTRRALAYVLGNFASHAARRGEPLPADHVDPFSSAAAICPDGLPPPVSRSRTWLLEEAQAAAAARPIPPAGEEVAPYAAAT